MNIRVFADLVVAAVVEPATRRERARAERRIIAVGTSRLLQLRGRSGKGMVFCEMGNGNGVAKADWVEMS